MKIGLRHKTRDPGFQCACVRISNQNEGKDKAMLKYCTSAACYKMKAGTQCSPVFKYICGTYTGKNGMIPIGLEWDTDEFNAYLTSHRRPHRLGVI